MSQDTSESPDDDADLSTEDFTVHEMEKELRGGANTVAWGGEGAGRGKAAQIYVGVLDVDPASAQGKLSGFYIRPQVTNKPVGSWEVHRVVVGDKVAPWRFTVVDSPPADCSTDEVSVEQCYSCICRLVWQVQQRNKRLLDRREQRQAQNVQSRMGHTSKAS